jgi:hypothetical protein
LLNSDDPPVKLQTISKASAVTIGLHRLVTTALTDQHR